VTVAILAFLLWRINLSSFADAIGKSVSSWLLLAFLANSLALFTSTYKWDRLLRALGTVTSKWQLLELYTIGFFMSSFLPGVVGGDVVRWQMTARLTGAPLKVAATILVERVTGVVALVILSVAAVLLLPQFAVFPVIVLIAAVSLGLAVGLVLVLHRRPIATLMFRTRRSRVGRIVQPLYGLHRTIRRFSRRALLVALGYSLLFYLSVGLTFFLIGRSFGTEITFLEATSVQILIGLLILIPITVGGLGLAQAGDIFLLGILGVDAAQALAISIVRLAVNYGYAMIGGFLFIRGCAQPKSDVVWNPTPPEAKSAGGLGSSVSK
jgi:uncharacterized protein (TIRG00374 family)